MIERAGAMGSWKDPCIDSVGLFLGGEKGGAGGIIVYLRHLVFLSVHLI
jgi:hypothetical protein